VIDDIRFPGVANQGGYRDGSPVRAFMIIVQGKMIEKIRGFFRPGNRGQGPQPPGCAGRFGFDMAQAGQEIGECGVLFALMPEKRKDARMAPCCIAFEHGQGGQ